MNLFAGNVVKVLNSLLAQKDLDLIVNTLPVFQSLCKYHDLALFKGSTEYFADFKRLVDSYYAFGAGSLGENELESKISVNAANSLSRSPVLNVSNFLSQTIPVALDNLCKSDFTEVERTMTPKGISRMTSSLDDDLPHESNPNIAMEALNNIFDTSSSKTLRLSTQVVLVYIFQNRAPSKWSENLFKIIIKRVPVQSRFSVPIELVDQLPVMDDNEKLIIVKLLTALLSASDVNMVGLSVIDIERTLLQHLLKVIQSTSKSDKALSYDLINATKDALISLGTHIYYGTQVSDIISEILVKYKFQNNAEFIRHSIEIVQGILNIAPKNTEISVGAWHGSQNLMNHESDQIRLGYLEVITKFIGKDHTFYEQVDGTFDVKRGPYGRVMEGLYKFVKTDPDVIDEVEQVIYKFIDYLGDAGLIRAAAFAFAIEKYQGILTATILHQVLKALEIETVEIDHSSIPSIMTRKIDFFESKMLDVDFETTMTHGNNNQFQFLNGPYPGNDVPNSPRVITRAKSLKQLNQQYHASTTLSLKSASTVSLSINPSPVTPQFRIKELKRAASGVDLRGPSSPESPSGLSLKTGQNRIDLDEFLGSLEIDQRRYKGRII